MFIARRSLPYLCGWSRLSLALIRLRAPWSSQTTIPSLCNIPIQSHSCHVVHLYTTLGPSSSPSASVPFVLTAVIETALISAIVSPSAPPIKLALLLFDESVLQSVHVIDVLQRQVLRVVQLVLDVPERSSTGQPDVGEINMSRQCRSADSMIL